MYIRYDPDPDWPAANILASPWSEADPTYMNGVRSAAAAATAQIWRTDKPIHTERFQEIIQTMWLVILGEHTDRFFRTNWAFAFVANNEHDTRYENALDVLERLEIETILDTEPEYCTAKARGFQEAFGRTKAPQWTCPYDSYSEFHFRQYPPRSGVEQRSLAPSHWDVAGNFFGPFINDKDGAVAHFYLHGLELDHVMVRLAEILEYVRTHRRRNYEDNIEEHQRLLAEFAWLASMARPFRVSASGKSANWSVFFTLLMQMIQPHDGVPHMYSMGLDVLMHLAKDLDSAEAIFAAWWRGDVDRILTEHPQLRRGLIRYLKT